ncbi:MAG: hypothetical protein R3200_17270, partial [Xanthomonadales bacterium]|nr:hypothetical protein [Xanthomonadales bacterium]
MGNLKLADGRRLLAVAIGLALSEGASAQECPAGTFSSTGSEPCNACARGFYQPLTGQTACDAADAGFFVPQIMQTTQFACTPGTYQPDPGQSACLDADPGFFVAGEQSLTQEACPVGQYQDQAGSSQCLDSPAGFFTNATGSEQAQACALGTYQPNTGSSGCIDASAGFFVGDTGQAAQTQCSLGTYQPDPGQSACLDADPGFFVAGTQSLSQEACATGTYQPDPGQTACLTADPGFFVESQGQSAQVACAVGTYQPNEGQGACIEASAGAFVATTASLTEESCPVGTYQPGTGQSSCIEAEVGFFASEPGSTAATECPAGSVSFGGSIACRAAPTTGPNIVSPTFGSSAGRGGPLGVIGLFEAGSDSAEFLFQIRNDANSIGAPDPLTRLTLNALTGSGPDGDLAVPTDLAGTVLDEGESLQVQLAANPQRMGVVSLPLVAETDEQADLGGDGLDFQFSLDLMVDGQEVLVELATDREEVVPGDTLQVFLNARNPGNADAPANDLLLNLGAGIECPAWTAVSLGGIGNPETLAATATDVVSLDARTQLIYVGLCSIADTASGAIDLSASIVPDPT